MTTTTVLLGLDCEVLIIPIYGFHTIIEHNHHLNKLVLPFTPWKLALISVNINHMSQEMSQSYIYTSFQPINFVVVVFL